jgi:hypothetical protein
MPVLRIVLGLDQIAQLETEAARRGSSSGDLAAEWVAERLSQCPVTHDRIDALQRALAEVDRLYKLRRSQGIPSIDAVAAVRGARMDLEERS